MTLFRVLTISSAPSRIQLSQRVTITINRHPQQGGRVLLFVCSQTALRSSNFLKMWLPIALAACILLGYQAGAQNVSLGDDVSRPIPGVGHDYVHGLSETVDPANGSLHVKIDLPVPKDRGFTLPFAITYDSGELYH